MPPIPGFVGGVDLAVVPLADPSISINLYPERLPPAGKSGAMLRYTPGLLSRWIVDDTPGRGIFTQDGRTWVVVGTTFAELNTDFTYTVYGSVANDGTVVQMCSNGSAGHQVMLTSGGLGYIFDTIANTLTQITAPDFPTNVGMCAFMDGYFLVNKRGSRQFNISALEDGTSWDALDVFERSIGSDDIVSFLRDHRTINIIGSKTAESWYDTGDIDIPFQPVQGAFMEMGSAAAYAAICFSNTTIWLGENEHGQGMVFAVNGFSPDRISAYAIERFIQDSTAPKGTEDLSGCVAFGTQEQGHEFYWLFNPRAIYTAVFDVSEKTWHYRAEWNPNTCVYEPHAGYQAAFCFGRQVLMSRLNGVIYELSQTTYRDELLS